MIKITDYKSSAGLTLVELLVTIAILGIILSWASADYSEVRQREKVNRVAQSLLDSIHFGQDYARHLSVPAALCAGTAEDKCQSQDWSKGWTLFYGRQDNTSQSLEPVRTYTPNNDGIQISVLDLQTPGKIVLNGEGFIKNNKNVTGIICDAKQGYYAQLEIGKAQTQKTSDFSSTTLNENCKNATG